MIMMIRLHIIDSKAVSMVIGLTLFEDDISGYQRQLEHYSLSAYYDLIPHA